MTDAKAILAERLARGEITDDEYDRLLGKLAATSPDTSPDHGKAADKVAPPEEKTVAITQNSADGWRTVKSLAPYAIGGYIGLALATYFVLLPPSKVEADGLQMCRANGRSASECLCFVNEMTKGYTVFNAPLRLLGIGLPSGATIAKNCSR